MASSFDIKLDERQKDLINAKLEKLETYRLEEFELEPLSEPDPPPEGYWAQNTTTAQKAAFFAQHPDGYERTGQLGESKSFEVEIRPLGTNTVMSIVATPEYAQFVVGESQAAFHKNRWWTLKDLASANLRKIYEALEDGLRHILE